MEKGSAKDATGPVATIWSNQGRRYVVMSVVTRGIVIHTTATHRTVSATASGSGIDGRAGTGLRTIIMPRPCPSGC